MRGHERLIPASPILPEHAAAVARLIDARREPDRDVLLSALGLAPCQPRRRRSSWRPGLRASRPGRRTPGHRSVGPVAGQLTPDELAWMVTAGYARPLEAAAGPC